MATRPIVISTVTPVPGGLSLVNFYARIPIAGAARQAFYARIQGGSNPSAPGDYVSADAQEATDFKAGKFREQQLYDVVDSVSTQGQRLQRMVNLAATVVSNGTTADDSLLAFYGSFYDGTSWTAKSA